MSTESEIRSQKSDLSALLPGDRVEIIIHRQIPDRPAFHRVGHASWIPGSELRVCSDEAAGAILLGAVTRCAGAIAVAPAPAASLRDTRKGAL